ncbi:MerR family DNA-binding transcriptional regulator [Methanosarcina siciliae]
MTYSIGEVAKTLNLTIYTLRYYDKEGLMPFVERTPAFRFDQ